MSPGPCRYFSESRADKPRQRQQYQISEQNCLAQRIRNQVEMDAQLAHRHQAEEITKEQHQSFYTAKRTEIDQQAQAPHRQNRHNSSSGQVKSNRYSGYNQAKRGSEDDQIKSKQLE